MSNVFGKFLSPPLLALDISIVALLFLGQRQALATTPQDRSQRQDHQTAEGGTNHRFLSALRSYKAQQYATAQDELEALVKSAPSSFEVNELLGLVYVAQGKQQEANHHLAKAVQLRPNIAEARTALATNLLALHHEDQAEIQFKRVLQLEPQSYDANHNLGEFYVQLGRLADAIVLLKRAQEADPRAENNGYDLALAYERNGNLEEARERVRALIRIKDSADLHSLLGEIEEKSKDYLASAAQYEQAVRMDPSEQNIFDWGTELLLHQTFEPAVDVFKGGSAHFPRSTRLQMGLGIALYGLGHFDDGARAFSQAADMDPSDPLPLTFLGRAYDNLSPSLADEVRARLQLFSSKNSGNAPVQYYYAICLWKENEKAPRADLSEQIESLLKTAVSIDPAYADAYLQLGILYANRKQYPEAISNYEAAVKVAPTLPDLHYRLGQALARSGDATHAREEFATFERLRQAQVNTANKQHEEIQQFVYTVRNSDDGNARTSGPPTTDGQK
jgi:tetratricopeptide (TPR) repeat protein